MTQKKIIKLIKEDLAWHVAEYQKTAEKEDVDPPQEYRKGFIAGMKQVLFLMGKK